MPLPAAFIKRIHQLMEYDEATAFFHTYQEERTRGLRVNPLKITPQSLHEKVDLPLQPVPFTSFGYYYNKLTEPGKHPFHQAGLYYIQEPSAMFIGEVVDAKPGERVLDLCAAPGGKSTQMAAAMENKGLLVTNEIYPKRAKALSENIERMGVTNALVMNETPERLAAFFPGYFDKILVDAPCSGEGMFRKDPDAAQYWSLDHVKDCATLQEEILGQAYRMLRTGGILVYSTCTFSPEENEQMIEKLLIKYPDLELLPIKKPAGIGDGRIEWTKTGNPALLSTARLWPHQLRGEGHFVAKMQKHGTAESLSTQRNALPVKEGVLKDYRQFEKETLTEKRSGTFYFSGNQLFLLPEDCPDFSKLKVLRSGLHLGEQKKNRFEPNHALALSLPAQAFRRQFPLRSTERFWKLFLSGETLPAPDMNKGWAVVKIDDYPLGWGKITNSTLKNFYPKGLRRRGPVQL
ncbi:RsmB/NOP family class I SAM-dependent RNA methyltransferase [Bacillaceae bacterium Marseille-Q3522]|nr:RsmB/NOP family class I SAM-dependent RNA methyltransferase [Bacillaceae bacterium Marseille-Q3522]